VPAVNAFLQDGVLVIDGTNQADTVLITQIGNRVLISQPGIADQTFRASQFRSILFHGFAGDDAFVNLTGIRSVAFGGAGNDLLYGGTGSNQLLGEAGNDTLVGNVTDRFSGGAGTTIRQTPAEFGQAGGLLLFDQRFSQGNFNSLSPTLQAALTGLLLQNGFNPFGGAMVNPFTSSNLFNGPTQPFGATPPTTGTFANPTSTPPDYNNPDAFAWY